MTPTPQQLAFVSELCSGTSSIALRACAGSGKTSTLVMGFTEAVTKGALRLGETLFLAFAKRNVEDLIQRLPPTAHVRTMNSLGLAAWAGHIGKRPIVDSYKTRVALKSLLPREYDRYEEVSKLIALAKNCALVPPGAPMGLNASSDSDFHDLAEAYDLGTSREIPAIANYAKAALRQSIVDALMGKIDYDDMLYMPVIYTSSFPPYSTVFVDEAQDLNETQHRMLELIRPKRLILAGDPRQAIYSFRGAKSHSMSELMAKFSAKEMPLTVSFRCPREVVREAQSFAPEIQSFEGAPAGTVSSVEVIDTSYLKHGNAVLCRWNAPLVKLALRLLTQGVPFTYAGRDFSRGLIAVMSKAQAPLTDYIQFWAKRERLEAEALGRFAKVETINDKELALLAIVESLGPTASPQDVVQRLEALFAGGHGVTLSTVHRAKGFEWEQVLWLDPARVKAKAHGGDEEARCISYVAITRAKLGLSYIEKERT